MTNSRSGAGWWILVTLAAAIAAYAFAYVVIGGPMYPPNLKDSFVSRPWGIYSHALFGGTAMILGPFQFRRDLLRNRPRHRLLGKIYLVASLGTGLAGFYMAIPMAG